MNSFAHEDRSIGSAHTLLLAFDRWIFLSALKEGKNIMLIRPAIVSTLFAAALLSSGSASADTVRNGRVVLMTLGKSGGGDSACQASPFDPGACEKAQRQYERTVNKVYKDYYKRVDNLQDKKAKQIDKADSADEKDQIRDDYRDDLEKAQEARDRKLQKAQSQL